MNNKVNNTSLKLIEGGSSFKQGDRPTLAFKALNYRGEVDDLAGKTITSTIRGSGNGIIFEGSAGWDASKQTITQKMPKELDHGTLLIEFIVTDPADPEFQVIYPSNESDGRLRAIASSESMDVVGVKSTTVTQLRAEQTQLQQEFESQVLPRVDTVEDKQTQLETQFTDVVSGVTDDAEILSARTGPDGSYATIGQRMDATIALLAEESQRIDSAIFNAGDGTVPAELTDIRELNNKTYTTAGQAIRALASGKAMGNDAITERSVAFINDIENLFDGQYIKAHYFGDLAIGATYVTTNSSARMSIVPVLPNTTYRIKKGASDRFGVATHSKLPTENEKLNRYLRFNQSAGSDYTFTTNATDRFVLIHVSSTGLEPDLTIREYTKESENEKRISFNKEVVASNIRLGKNRFDGTWQTGTLLGDNNENGSLTANNGKVSITPVPSNTSITISKSKSNRFKVGVSSILPTVSSGSVIRIVYFNDSSNECTITTGENEKYLVVYASFGEESPAFMQVEEGGTKTEWETHGYKITPFAKPHVSSGNFSHIQASLSDFGVVGDGVTDDTVAIQQAFDEVAGGSLFVPSQPHILKGTVYINSHTILEGVGEGSQFILGDDYSLDSVLWRGAPSAFPILSTRKNARDIKVKGIRVTGNKNQFTDQRQFGLGLVDCEDVLVEDAIAEYINFFPNLAGTTVTNALGYSLALLRAKRVHILRGKYEYGGYENFGSEDVDDVKVDSTYFGSAWRTSFQLHRGSKNMVMDNITVDHEMASGIYGVTLHGAVDNPVENITFSKMLLKADTHPDLSGIQTVEGNEHGVSITDSTILVSKEPIVTRLGADNWTVKGTRIKSGREGLKMNGNNAIIKDNHVDAEVSPAIKVDGDNNTIKDNKLLTNKEVLLTGIGNKEVDNG